MQDQKMNDASSDYTKGIICFLGNIKLYMKTGG